MFVRWLRESNVSAILLTLIRLYLGYNWITAGYHKLADGFDASGFLGNATKNPVKGPDGGLVYGWYVSFLKNFALPNVEIFNVVVPLGEFLIGLGLILGCLTTAAAFFALLMNFSFFMAGTVSHNPTDIFLGTLILVSGYNAGRFGLDRFVVPFFRRTLFRRDDAGNRSPA